MAFPSPEMYPDWRGWAQAMLQKLSIAPDPVRLIPFIKAELPDARRAKYMQVYCTDLATPQPVYSDGTNWRKVTDGAIA